MMLATWLDYTVNGLIIGNIYALLAVGLALIFGVANLINFAHGSVYTVGAYVGWAAITYLHTPLPLTLLLVIVACGFLGIAIERLGPARPARTLAHRALARHHRHQPGARPACAVDLLGPIRGPCRTRWDWRFHVGSGTIGALDVLIAGIGLGSAALLYGFLRFTKLGWAVRATAQDQDAARQMGVDTDRVNLTVFAIASALGGVSGLLVGMYYNDIDPNMSFDATLKGVVAMMIGGLGNVPGAIGGGLLLGLTESYGIALFGSSYRNLFAFVLLILILVAAPNGLFQRRRETPPEPMTGTFIARSRPVRLPRTLIAAVVVTAALLPLADVPYLLQTLTNGLLAALLALSLTLVAGTVGQVSLGHAALLAIGGYASACWRSILAGRWRFRCRPRG